MARPSGRPIRAEIVDGARVLIQTVGVEAFSYGQLAHQLGIKPPSIHHYFPTKDTLVAEVVHCYSARFNDDVRAIVEGAVANRLAAYARLFTTSSTEGLICLCGALASDWALIGDSARHQVREFFNDQVTWISGQLEAGRKSGEFRDDIDIAAIALTVLAALEGSMLMVRSGYAHDLAATINRVLVALLAPYARAGGTTGVGQRTAAAARAERGETQPEPRH